MAKFKFTELVPQDSVISAKLGVDANSKLTDADVGKAVKLIAADTYGLCAVNDEIEGFLVAVDSATADGLSFGSVQISGRKSVVLDGAVTIGALVLTGTPIARNTALTVDVAVKTGTAASQSGTTPFAFTQRTPNTHLWRLVSGTGLNGAVGVIERVGDPS